MDMSVTEGVVNEDCARLPVSDEMLVDMVAEVSLREASVTVDGTVVSVVDCAKVVERPCRDATTYR
jgi:hypothetical protein